MRILATVLLCLVMAGTAIAADRTVTATPLDGPILTYQSPSPAGVCVYGNDTSPVWAITDWIWGAESYATSFVADHATCGCGGGFKIEQVHFYMNFGEEDVPFTFEASAIFHEADPDPTSGCKVPGPVICSSPVYSITIPAAGIYDIALPMDQTTCGCAYFEYGYAVGVNILTDFPSSQRPDAVTDGVPVGCTSWNDYGAGWEDLISFGFPGELVLYADVVCCDSPVAGEISPWGSLKSLFR